MTQCMEYAMDRIAEMELAECEMKSIGKPDGWHELVRGDLMYMRLCGMNHIAVYEGDGIFSHKKSDGDVCREKVSRIWHRVKFVVRPNEDR